MPRMLVEKEYGFEGPNGPATLADLFEGRCQLVIYRLLCAGRDPAPGGSYPERAASAAHGSPTRSRIRPT